MKNIDIITKIKSTVKYRLSVAEKATGKWARIWFRNKSEQKRLTNHDFTIISSNCVGGVISHDLGKRFNSPTVNTFIPPYHFVRFMENMDDYLKSELEFTDKFKMPYPVAYLKDVPIFFVHFHSEEEAKLKWNERKERIKKDNLFVIMTDRYCCPYKALERFDKLPYKNKVCFTKKNYPEFNSCVQITKGSDETCVGIITDIVSFTGKRMYQFGFDYIKWLNDGKREG